MTNKNIPRKNVRSYLFLEASIGDSHLAKNESDKPVVSTAFELDESHIMSRRPTRLSMELLSRAKENRSLPDAEKIFFGVEELPQK